MKLGSLVLSFLALACAGWLESASLADSHGEFPGKGSVKDYIRALEPMNKGSKKYYEQDFESAIRFANEAIAIYPYDSATHQNLGNALRRSGKYQDAIPELKKAIELEPNYLSAWLGLGSANESLGRLSEAERCYRKAAEIKPDSFGALFDLGDILRQQGKIQEAKLWLVKAKNCPDGKEKINKINNALNLCERRQGTNSREASN